MPGVDSWGPPLSKIRRPLLASSMKLQVVVACSDSKEMHKKSVTHVQRCCVAS